MIEEQTLPAFTVIFLCDQLPPTKLAMLKRTSGRFGGDLYTGLGGHFEPDKDKDMQSSAERELFEEAEAYADTPITEFARCMVNGEEWLHYFWGVIDPNKPLARADEREGVLSWESVESVLSLPVFPTTLSVMEEWKNRGFKVDRPWTMWVHGIKDEKNVTRNVQVEKIKGGLTLLEA